MVEIYQNLPSIVPSMSTPADSLARLLDLSHQLVWTERKVAIRGEGDTSTRGSADTFLVRARGSNLAALAATLMGAKAAEIFAGAAAMGGQPRFLTPAQVVRIAGRPDEHDRQKALGL
jgi:hypothetical protein